MLQCLACIFELAACLSGNDEMRDAAQMLRFIVDCTYTVIISCMAAQVQAELNAEKSGKAEAPINLTMHRPGEVAPPLQQGGAPPPMQPATAVAQPMGGRPFMVAVPPGVAPGQQIMIASPYTGQQLAVTVPAGLVPGMQFQVMG